MGVVNGQTRDRGWSKGNVGWTRCKGVVRGQVNSKLKWLEGGMAACVVYEGRLWGVYLCPHLPAGLQFEISNGDATAMSVYGRIKLGLQIRES